METFVDSGGAGPFGSDNQGGKLSLTPLILLSGLRAAQAIYKIRSYVRNNLVHK